MPRNTSSPTIEEKLQAITRMPAPPAQFVDELWLKMESKSRTRKNQSRYERPVWKSIVRRLQTAGQWTLGLAGMGLLIALTVWAIQLRPQNTREPAGVVGSPTPVAQSATPPADPTALPSALPTQAVTFAVPNQVAPGACGMALEDGIGNLANQAAPFFSQAQVESLVGGGNAESGDFSFSLWLACSSGFGQQVETQNEFSEINGLGLFVNWEYHGSALDGQIRDYLGFEPYVQEHGSSGPISNGSSNFEILGIQFPAGIIPDFSQDDTQLRFLVKTSMPDGKIAGAVLTFVLARQPDGYQPTDIRVEPLTEAELQTGTDPQMAAEPPFPTRDPEQLYPELQAAQALIDAFQQPLRATPGWVYVRTRMQDPDGNGLYGSLTEWVTEGWLELDENGLVVTEIHIERRPDGQVLQQVISVDGETQNLTYATGGAFTPYLIDLSGGLYDSLLQRLRSGETFERSEIQVDGKPAWLYAFTDSFTEPTPIDNISTAALQSRNVYDQESGAPLYFELVRTLPDGQESLVWRQTYEEVRRVSEPPAEALALLGQSPSSYQPLPVEGTPAPVGFDATLSALTLRTVPGDDFNAPSFFYGDIYAGEYLLGRVDFGASPGGYCDRSGDGSRLAFSYLVIPNENESRSTLRWFDLGAIDQVYAPAPDLELVSYVSWAPQDHRLAFLACKAGQVDCGLYVLDTDTGELRLLSRAGVSFVPPVWKPDGSQVAFLNSDINNVYTLYVVDAASGQLVYQGPFNAGTWQAASESPTQQWNVEIPHGFSESSCFTYR